MEIKSSDFYSTTMTTAKAFDSILQQIQNSNLNFKLQLSPFSANISLRKSPVIDKFGNPLLPCVASAEKFAALSSKNKQLECDLLKVKNELADTVDECEKARNKIKDLNLTSVSAFNQELLASKTLVEELKATNDEIVKENVQLLNKLSEIETKMIDLNSSNKVQKEVSIELNRNMSDLKTRFKRE